MANVEILPNMTGESQEIVNEEEGESSIESSEFFEFAVNSGEANSSHASTEELHKLTYQNMMQEEYIHQLMYPIKEVNLARLHEYRAMVMARLNGHIGEQDYMMLVDSGSELNIMMMHQAQELALPIDDSGNSWMLKGISRHMMGLEGICWNVPVKIGGIEFSHNFFIMRSDLGNKDMVLGQPWLFSHSTRIDYVHEMGVTLQLWENGDRKGRSILINLPLVKAPRNVMPIRLRRNCESNSAQYDGSQSMKLAGPGTDPSSLNVLKFMNRVIEALQIREENSEKPRPDGLSEDLILEQSLSMPFVAEAMRNAWFVSVKRDAETFSERIEKLKRNVGISPIYDSVFTARECNGAKYKPVARKVVPVSTQDPGATIPMYREIQIKKLEELPVSPKRIEELRFTKRLTKERVSSIIAKIPAGFLTKAEAELLIHILFRYEGAIAFTDLEHGTFSREYYPDYVIRTVPHQPWQKKPIRLPQSRREEVARIMKEQIRSGKYEP